MQHNERGRAAQHCALLCTHWPLVFWYRSLQFVCPQQLENANTLLSQASQLVMGVGDSMRFTKHARHLPGRQHVRQTISIHSVGPLKSVQQVLN
jgi:hypothetical protein